MLLPLVSMPALADATPLGMTAAWTAPGVGHYTSHWPLYIGGHVQTCCSIYKFRTTLLEYGQTNMQHAPLLPPQNIWYRRSTSLELEEDLSVYPRGNSETWHAQLSGYNYFTANFQILSHTTKFIIVPTYILFFQRKGLNLVGATISYIVNDQLKQSNIILKRK